MSSSLYTNASVMVKHYTHCLYTKKKCFPLFYKVCENTLRGWRHRTDARSCVSSYFQTWRAPSRLDKDTWFHRVRGQPQVGPKGFIPRVYIINLNTMKTWSFLDSFTSVFKLSFVFLVFELFFPGKYLNIINSEIFFYISLWLVYPNIINVCGAPFRPICFFTTAVP